MSEPDKDVVIRNDVSDNDSEEKKKKNNVRVMIVNTHLRLI